jgi:hypothetical protein
MTVHFDSASLGIQLSSESHSTSEVGYIVDIIDSLPMVSFWSALVTPETNDKNIFIARELLSESAMRGKAKHRFYPLFHRDFHLIDENRYAPFQSLPKFDSFDPLDIGVIAGVNTWAKRVIFQKDKNLYNQLFNFAAVSKLEHHSPLVIELAIAISIPSLPIILTYGLMRAAASYRRLSAEADIREKEADIKDEELKQKRIQTAILEEMKSSIEQQGIKKEKIRIPEKALENVATFGVSSVAELAHSPLIDKMTFGISTKS